MSYTKKRWESTITFWSNLSYVAQWHIFV